VAEGSLVRVPGAPRQQASHLCRFEEALPRADGRERVGRNADVDHLEPSAERGAGVQDLSDLRKGERRRDVGPHRGAQYVAGVG
jgi:hypothetical protein